MTTTADSISVPQPDTASLIHGQAPSTARFDARMIFCTLWLTLGQSLDAAAHNARAVDTFFSPWHLVLYSGAAACALILFIQIWRNQAAGYRGWKAIPRGYQAAAVGIVFLGIGGFVDLIWHSVLGIEFDLVAIFSPSHFLGFAAVGLIYSGLISSVWWRRKMAFTNWRTDWPDYVPLLIGILLECIFAATISFPFQPIGSMPGSADALASVAGDMDNSVLIGMPAIVIQTILMMGILLMMLRRFRLLPGTVFLILALPNIIVGAVAQNLGLIPVALLTGLIADVLVQRWQPGPLRPAYYRATAFFVPVIFYALYFASLIAQHNLAWEIRFWTGAITLSGGVGVIISYLIVPAPSLVVIQSE